MADKHSELQEQSIKARKHQLFEADLPTAATGSGRPFSDFLRETPAAPLPGAARGILWAAGVVVVILLVAALLKVVGRHSTPGARPGPAATAGGRPG